MIINVKTSLSNYDVVIEKGIINNINKHLNTNRKVLIISDSGVPFDYVEKVKSQCENALVYIIPQGEASKSFDNYHKILSFMVANDFKRTDAIIALGGGVVGDLSGFVASSFMRGIDFYNIPTTLLSQVDSSIGGKTAIDLDGIKNIVGAFYPPKCVLIDSNTLKTLDERQIHNGLAESIKMALTSSKELFDLIYNSTDLLKDIDEIIYKSLLIKKAVVEKDEKEKGLRKILNFGHTIGHAIESINKFNLLHGECVAIGMTYMVSNEVLNDLTFVLKKYNLPTTTNISTDEIIKLINHDKKASGENIDIITVDKIGTYQIKNIKIKDLLK